MYIVSLKSCHNCNLLLIYHCAHLLFLLSPLALRSGSGSGYLPLLIAAESFNAVLLQQLRQLFSLTLRTFKHKKFICTYLSSHLARLHNKLYSVRLSRNLYVYYVHSSRNLYIHYVHLSRNLYVHYVRLSTSIIF